MSFQAKFTDEERTKRFREHFYINIIEKPPEIPDDLDAMPVGDWLAMGFTFRDNYLMGEYSPDQPIPFIYSLS